MSKYDDCTKLKYFLLENGCMVHEHNGSESSYVTGKSDDQVIALVNDFVLRFGKRR